MWNLKKLVWEEVIGILLILMVFLAVKYGSVQVVSADVARSDGCPVVVIDAGHGASHLCNFCDAPSYILCRIYNGLSQNVYFVRELIDDFDTIIFIDIDGVNHFQHCLSV